MSRNVYEIECLSCTLKNIFIAYRVVTRIESGHSSSVAGVLMPVQDNTLYVALQHSTRVAHLHCVRRHRSRGTHRLTQWETGYMVYHAKQCNNNTAVICGLSERWFLIVRIWPVAEFPSPSGRVTSLLERDRVTHVQYMDVPIAGSYT